MLFSGKKKKDIERRINELGIQRDSLMLEVSQLSQRKEQVLKEIDELAIVPPFVKHYKTIQDASLKVSDLAWYLENNKDESTDEINIMLENAQSRMEALRDAMLIKIRSEMERERTEKMKRKLANGREEKETIN